jgi:hemerythrin-like domain-containing protein
MDESGRGATSNQRDGLRERFTMVYLIHGAFRRDFGRLRDAVATPGVDRTTLERLHAHWQFVSGQLEHHHRVEDEVMWPLVRPKLAGNPDGLAVLDRMEAQHRTFAPARDAVEQAFDSWFTNAGTAQDLAPRLDDLRTCVADHLDNEEADAFPLIDSALDDQEFASFEKATAKATGLRGAAEFFPWILDDADEADRNRALCALPTPIRALCRRRWVPRYERQTADLWPS